MSKWTHKAADLQAAVRASELENAERVMYEEDDVRRATVHSRDDIVLLVSLLTSVNEQLSTIKMLLIVLGGVMGALIIFG